MSSVELVFQGSYDCELEFLIDDGGHGIALELNVYDTYKGDHTLTEHTYLGREDALKLAHTILEILK